MSQVTFSFADGTTATVENDASLKMSKFLSGMLDDCDTDSDDVIPLAGVPSLTVWNEIYKFMKLNGASTVSVKKPLAEDNFIGNVTATDDVKNFVTELTKDEPLAAKLILASNYLDIEPLLTLLCAWTASLIRNKSPDVIKQLPIRFGMSVQ